MTVNKNSLTRVALFTLAALAGLFTVLSVTALASRQKTHRDLENLLQRYQVKDNAEDDPQNDAPGDKEGQEKPKPPPPSGPGRANKQKALLRSGQTRGKILRHPHRRTRSPGVFPGRR